MDFGAQWASERANQFHFEFELADDLQFELGDLWSIEATGLGLLAGRRGPSRAQRERAGGRVREERERERKREKERGTGVW